MNLELCVSFWKKFLMEEIVPFYAFLLAGMMQ